MKLTITLDITQDQKRILLQSYKTTGITTTSKHDADIPALNTLIGDILEASKKAFTLGANVRRRRLELFMSQTQLAVKSGVSKAYVSRIERSERSPSIPRLAKIAVALGVDIKELFGEE